MRGRVFIDRRDGDDRRDGNDPRKSPRLDLAHRRRRKGADRRKSSNLLEDYTAMVGESALETQKDSSAQQH